MLIAEKHFEANVDCLSDFLEFAEKHAISVGMPEEKMMHFQIALEEIFVNIASYAYPENVKGKIFIKIFFSKTKRHITVEFMDEGEYFDPLQKNAPDTNSTLEERNVGGLGILFAKKMAQDIHYKRESDKNVLGLVFYA